MFDCVFVFAHSFVYMLAVFTFPVRVRCHDWFRLRVHFRSYDRLRARLHVRFR